MYLADVVFPQNIQYLTYRVPEKLKETLKEGQLVTAPIKGREKVGLLIKVYSADGSSDFNSALKPLNGIFESDPIFHPPLIKLLNWMSEYYLSNHGIALKSMLFDEIVRKPSRSAKKTIIPEPVNINIEKPSSIDRLIKAICKERGFKSTLYMAHSEQEEILLSETAIRQFDTALILSPEIEDAEILFGHLYRIFPDEVCLYHSKLPFSRRYESINGFLKGRFRVIVGTRSIVFTPARVSLIIVTREHSFSYKQEESPRVNTRDVAVMRAFLEGIPVVLSSVTPSSETYLNFIKGKYKIVRSSYEKPPPLIQVINTRKEKEIAPYLTRRVVDSMKKHLKDGVLGIIQRLGYSMIRCEECNEVISCSICSRPLMLHKQRLLLCHHCGRSEKLPDSCPNCGSHILEYFGAGMERIQEAIDKLFTTTGKLSEQVLDEGKQTILVGTLSKKGLRRSRFSLIAFLNPDIMLNQPDIKSMERLVQEVFSLRELLKERGVIQLQTTLPWHPVFDFLRKWDQESFLKSVLSKRKKLNLPPYAKTILVEAISKNMKDVENLYEWASEKNLPAIGPLNELRKKKEVFVIKVIIMKKTMKAAHCIAMQLISEIKRRRLSYRVDVEPIKIGY